MELATVNTDKGNINISRMTIETLIYLVLKDIKGVVVPRKTRLRELSNKINKSTPEKNEGISQEIKIEIKPDSVIVNLFLIINYGIRIPDLTWEIQAKVKERLKEIAGLDVNIINIHINGIRYPNKYQNKDKLIIPEMFVKIF
jgi:uncharacterized alkaline shock family protein YloU